MGTCYYLYESGNLLDRLALGKSAKRLIGKSSGGWCFSLRVYPEEGINSLRDWYQLFRRNQNTIKNEYDDVITVDDMLDTIMNRARPPRTFIPSQNYQTEQHFLDLNQAIYGPNNLLRSRISDRCIGHGPGTWDLIDGDFS